MSELNLNLNTSTSGDAGRVTSSSSSSNTTREQKMNTAQPGTYDPFATLGVNTLFGQRVNASTGSEGFSAMVEIMNKTLKAAREDDRFDVVPFPKEVHTDLTCSVIAIVRNNKVPMAPGVPAHQFVTAQILLIEASGDSLRPYQSDDGNRSRSYTITPSAEDIYNRLLTDYVRKQLQTHYGESVKSVYLIDPVIVRRTFKMDAEESVKAQLVESQVAVETRSHVRVKGFKDFNYVQRLGGNDLQLPVTVTMTGGETRHDTQGLPIYSDAVVEVAVERSNGRNNRAPVPNSPDTSKKICQAGVMVELVPVDPILLEENRSNGRRDRRDFVPEVAWAPRVVVTSIEQFLTRTPSGIWFALASIAELGNKRLWAQTFRRAKGKNDEQNLRDIGYLNIEANLDTTNEERYGRVIDTSVGHFDDRDMGKLLDNTVTHYPMFAVDCLTTGSQAYYTTDLYNMARGSEEAKRHAKASIISSLRDATDNRIDDFIDLSTVRILEDEGELLHMGHWFDNHSQMRDNREIDNYLAMAKRFGDNNPDMIKEWCDTWLRGDVSEAQRMSDRLTLLQSAATGTVNVTGTALRVTLNADLINAFALALDAGNLPLVSRDGNDGDQFHSQRSVHRTTQSTLYRGRGFGNRNDRTGSGGRYNNSYAASRV